MRTTVLPSPAVTVLMDATARIVVFRPLWSRDYGNGEMIAYDEQHIGHEDGSRCWTDNPPAGKAKYVDLMMADRLCRGCWS